MKFRFLTPASIELDEAIAFLESQQHGLGFRFATAIENTFSRIALFPEGYPSVGKYSRRCLVAKFPYGVVYQPRLSEQQILVVAVAHLHRYPDYWQSRESPMGKTPHG